MGLGVGVFTFGTITDGCELSCFIHNWYSHCRYGKEPLVAFVSRDPARLVLTCYPGDVKVTGWTSGDAVTAVCALCAGAGIVNFHGVLNFFFAGLCVFSRPGFDLHQDCLQDSALAKLSGVSRPSVSEVTENACVILKRTSYSNMKSKRLVRINTTKGKDKCHRIKIH
jgi:hypothetical protein